MPADLKTNSTTIDAHDSYEPVSVMDLYTIGIGPSSSHTVGPMRAARRFCRALKQQGCFGTTARVETGLFGSLALTGKGHSTDKAILLGLSGARPSEVDPDKIDDMLELIRQTNTIRLLDQREIPFEEERDLLFLTAEILPQHPNGMTFKAFDADGGLLLEKNYFSVGGGFIVSDENDVDAVSASSNIRVKYPFSSARELLEIGEEHNCSIAEIMRANEIAWRGDDETGAFLTSVADAMFQAIERAFTKEGSLPGGLNVQRRARALHLELTAKGAAAQIDPLNILDWVNLYALAVNEENAGGGRVVTAPTNGAAGVIPAVLKYYRTFCPGADQAGVHDFLLTAAAIGTLYKKRASLSAAEMGCQGEVGVACSMAAGGLTAVLGGSNKQIENAAEIGMEHNLGLTCDPVGGLVQIPCIERNTMGAVKAINAARLALHGDGSHIVSLDDVIETMRQTGEDMQSKYKETSQGGLAVNVVEC